MDLEQFNYNYGILKHDIKLKMVNQFYFLSYMAPMGLNALAVPATLLALENMCILQGYKNNFYKEQLEAYFNDEQDRRIK